MGETGFILDPEPIRSRQPRAVIRTPSKQTEWLNALDRGHRVHKKRREWGRRSRPPGKTVQSARSKATFVTATAEAGRTVAARGPRGCEAI